MSGIHFSIGSAAGQRSALEHARATGRNEASLDLSQDLSLVKSTMLYADRVTLYSLGSSILSSIAAFKEASTQERARVAVRFLPHLRPETPEKNLELLQAAVGLRGRDAQRRISKRNRQRLFAMANENFDKLEDMVFDQHRAAGIEGFREAVDSGMLEIHSFRQTSVEALVEATIRGDGDLFRGADVPDVMQEYVEQVGRTLHDGGTYPVFDDLTGEFVSECISGGLIVAPRTAQHRSRYGGLAADLLGRLPSLEQATLEEALDVRRELDDPLRGFRLAVADFSREIASAGWSAEFSEEAEALFREKVEPEVQRIEAAISENNDLRRLLERAVDHGPAGISIGAVVASASDLSNLAAAASGIAATAVRAGIERRRELREIESNRLYFFYRAERRLSGG